MVDASVVVAALLVDSEEGDAAREALRSEAAHAPHLLDVEVTSAVRRWVLAGRLTVEEARSSIRDLGDLAITRHGHEPLLDRVLELRDVVSAYDGTYVALAELLGATVVTGDRRLSRAPGLRCPVSVIG
ncbi:type II toxin-antitoxin system VapC family toxin [Geodermatophilus sp. URMC 65]